MLDIQILTIKKLEEETEMPKVDLSDKAMIARQKLVSQLRGLSLSFGAPKIRPATMKNESPDTGWSFQIKQA